jgi:hypothetical protein
MHYDLHLWSTVTISLPALECTEAPSDQESRTAPQVMTNGRPLTPPYSAAMEEPMVASPVLPVSPHLILLAEGEYFAAYEGKEMRGSPAY